jgi:hypothetical protein
VTLQIKAAHKLTLSCSSFSKQRISNIQTTGRERTKKVKQDTFVKVLGTSFLLEVVIAKF